MPTHYPNNTPQDFDTIAASPQQNRSGQANTAPITFPTAPFSGRIDGWPEGVDKARLAHELRNKMQTISQGINLLLEEFAMRDENGRRSAFAGPETRRQVLLLMQDSHQSLCDAVEAILGVEAAEPPAGG